MARKDDEILKLCDCCHLRVAVHRIHYDRTGHSRHSCQVCLENFPSPNELAMRIEMFLLSRDNRNANTNLRPLL